ncbi:MAG: hypothetical protein A4E32_01885 [Methanomassiliicoccales archaeon PtaU1.Bin124]|nr:MAG: hypothetical protein A4E32_01885 [Methanomassiliicoccales archaeon PtaU1.Bin124]
MGVKKSMFDSLPFMPKAQGPPWLPAAVAEARQWAYWGVLIAFIFVLIGIIVTIVAAIFAPGILITAVISLVISIVVLFLIKSTIFDPLDQGRFRDTNIFFLIWGILGLFIYLIPGILILIGFIKLQEVFSPQYQQYQAQPGYQAPPPAGQQPQQQYQAPPPQQQAPAPQAPAQPEQHAQQKVEMVKCAKCGVQYPAFMHHCPNCNTPR